MEVRVLLEGLSQAREQSAASLPVLQGKSAKAMIKRKKIRIPDDVLIDFATTCSNHGLRLHAEMILRKRYPSRKATRRIAARFRKVNSNHEDH